MARGTLSSQKLLLALSCAILGDGMGCWWQNRAVLPTLFVQLFSGFFLLLFHCVAETSSVDSWALPELFLFMDSCLIIGLGGGHGACVFLCCHISLLPSSNLVSSSLSHSTPPPALVLCSLLNGTQVKYITMVSGL